MKVFSLLLAGALLARTSLAYKKLRTSSNGFMWLLPKVSVQSLSLEISLVGLAGAVVGAITGSRSVAVGYGLLALAAGTHVVRIWRTREVFTSAFGSIQSAVDSRPYLLTRRWGVRIGAVPEPRVQHDVPFCTVPGGSRAPVRHLAASGRGPAIGAGPCVPAWQRMDAAG